MKYAQLIIGLLAGTAIGGSVVAGTGAPIGAGAGMDNEGIKKIVREVIADEPKLIMESVQKFQMEEQKKQSVGASEMLKDKAINEQVFNDPNAATYGPKESKHVLVQFFDYNCGACKYMFKTTDALVKKDKTIRVVFHEYPIFGPASEANARIGLAVNRLNPDKYYDFHVKMMSATDRTDEKTALKFASELGLDAEKIKAEAAKPEVTAILDANRKLGEKLRIQGTPTLVIGDEVIPHALSFEDVEARFAGTAAAKPDATKADEPKPE